MGSVIGLLSNIRERGLHSAASPPSVITATLLDCSLGSEQYWSVWIALGRRSYCTGLRRVHKWSILIGWNLTPRGVWWTALPDDLITTSPFVQQNYLLTDWLISLTSLRFQPRFWLFLRLLAAGNLLKMGGLAPRGSPTHFRRLPAACSLRKRQNLAENFQRSAQHSQSVRK